MARSQLRFSRNRTHLKLVFATEAKGHVMGAFHDSATILVREGLEALLVLAAIGASLARRGATDRLQALIAGAAAGVVASLATAWAFAAFNNGAHDDLIEAGVMLGSAGLLLYVSGWLFLRQDPRRWTRYLEAQVARAEGAGSKAALVGIGFLAIYREGAETALFLHALALPNGWTPALLGGIAAGTAILCVGFVAVKKLAIRLPLRPLFLASSIFLFGMALRFIAGAVQELQEQTLLAQTDAGLPDWLADIAGNGTWEALGPQFFLVSLAVATVAWTALQRRRDADTSNAVPKAG
jgi:high-affinity iron transporter